MLADKPAGVTSHDVVARVRRERGGRVGHAGTLDPFATGLLILLLGRATRLQRHLLGLSKTYRAVARLGWTSTTGDPDGELTETGRIPDSLELPTGRITQRVPMTSAVKVRGERLYRKAHRGEQVQTPEREVTVHRAELVAARGDLAEFEIECSSGTYVRTLIETLGDAYCAELRRTAIGPHAVPADGADREVAPAELVSFLPRVELDADAAAMIAHGRAVPAEPPGPALSDAFGADPEAVALVHDGGLAAIARPDGENLRPEVVLI